MAGEGDAASETGSSESGERETIAWQPPGPINCSPGIKLVIGEDEETMKSVSEYVCDNVSHTVGHNYKDCTKAHLCIS